MGALHRPGLSHRRLHAWLSAVPLFAAVGVSHAQGAGMAIRLEIQSPQGCTSVSDLESRIRARVRNARFDEHAAFVARASFTNLASGNVVADLTLTEPNSTASSRRVIARSCAQAADAVALIVSVTLDPNAMTEKASSRSARSGVDDPRATEASGSQTDPARPKAPETAIERRSPGSKREPGTPLEDASDDTSPALSKASVRRLGVHLMGGVIGGIAPDIMPAVGAGGIVALDRETAWSPALAFTVAHGFRTSAKEPGGTARFALDALSIDVCPLRAALRAGDLRACASTLLGRLSAEGTETTNSAGVVHRPFAAAGVSSILTLRIAPLFEFWARASAGVNLVRDSFEFAPITVHSVGAVNYAGGLGLGLRSR